MLLDRAHEQLSWPSSDEVLSPAGEGARLYVRLASEKLGKALSLRPDGQGVEVGVLAADPEATEAPLALVCMFPKKVSNDTLREAQKLAWNFGYAPLLITVEPHVLRTWTCYEPPTEEKAGLLTDTPEIEPPLSLDERTGAFLSDRAAASLHWVELLTGHFFQRHEARFRPEKRADQMLLGNLREVRQKLMDRGLSDDISHDLLARIIFIQFLFDRKDTDGRAALNTAELRRLHEERVLSAPFATFGEILDSYEDTYALFRWLDGKFNGDLFPGKDIEAEQEAAWVAERAEVGPEHLALLSRFVRGEERMRDGQFSLWPYYAFDAIPLEVISTIYEQFVKKDAGTGVHYTPAHVADLLLDSVLPWQGEDWDLKVLDPSCGSGVFLVKAYQRLIHRWKRAHPSQRIGGEVLARLLEHNLFGVDMDEHAVRTASFSLYLAMCDEIDPRDYWKEVRFPILRGRRLIAVDFFSQEHAGFRTADGPTYDLVIGNPPWGRNTVHTSQLAEKWQQEHRWLLPQGDIGPLFVTRALAITKPGGSVALLQPASSLLYNQSTQAQKFRERLFQTVQVQEILNLAALRHGLFRGAIVPACALILRNSPPSGDPFWYVCPKRQENRQDGHRILIEPQDVHTVLPQEVLAQPWIWSALLWGGRRDLRLLSRLRRANTLAALEQDGRIQAREGFIRGNRKQHNNAIVGRRLLETGGFPSGEELFLRARDLPVNEDPWIDERHGFANLDAFQLPQLIVRQSWKRREGRFHAVMVHSDAKTGGVLCTHSFLSVHAGEESRAYLEAACLSYNSAIAVYYLLLTSGRFAMDRNEPETKDFRRVPLPEPRPGLLDGVETLAEADERAREVFGLPDAEWLLVEDLMQFTLPDYKDGSDSPGRRTTQRRGDTRVNRSADPELTHYCETFLRVLHAAYGKDKPLGAVIYSEPDQDHLPVRMVSFFLNLPEIAAVRTEAMESAALRERLTTLYRTMLSTEEDRHKFYQRTARTYETMRSESGRIGIRINFIKPDKVRYWTRSMALRDADAVAADIMVWSSVSAPTTSRDDEVEVA
jgi:hypothetical protein